MRENKIILFAAFILSAALLSSCSEPAATPYVTDVFAFDTVCSVTVYKNTETLKDDVNSAVTAAERLLDLNGQGKQYVATVPEETLTLTEIQNEIISKAYRVSEISDGLFDITTAPLISLWDIGNADCPPNDDDIRKALNNVGYRNIHHESETLFFPSQGMGIDIGAVGKGFSGDNIAYRLSELGYDCGIVNLGGNVRVFGQNPRRLDGFFVVGIKDPRRPERIFCTVSVSDCSVITSGAYERYFEFEGKIYHHIIDPFTGYPSESDLESVTVISSDGTYADALSTAVFLCGTEKGLRVLENAKNQIPDLSAILVSKDGTVTTFNIESRGFRLVSDEYTLSDMNDEN